jgi:heat shock protein HtpX
MYIVDFFKNLFRKKNIGLIIWLVLNTALIIAMFSGGFASWQGALLGLGIYLLSLVVALSPIGEWILRLQTGCKKMTNADDVARLQPIFDEVYAKAKAKNPELPDKVTLFINESDDPNAFATGRKTVCVTRGLFNYSDEHIKGVLAHEFGHLAHKDTDAILVVSVGNMIVTTLFVIIRVLANISMGIAQFLNAIFSEGWGGVIASIFISISRVVADVLLVLLMRLWTQIGVWLCMSSSRGNEYEADQYAYECGYGEPLCQVLESFGSDGGSKGLFAALSSSHPDNDKRIAKIRELALTAPKAQIEE